MFALKLQDSYNQVNRACICGPLASSTYRVSQGRKLRVANSQKKYTKAEEERKRKLRDDALSSIFREVKRPRNMRDLGLTTLKNLPSNVGMVQGLMKAVNWKTAQQEVLEGLNNTVVIVGLPNTGKSTLFNKLKGQNLSPTSAQVGTTKTLMRTDFGPFTLVDTPGHLPDVMESGMSQASVIVFLIDASRGLQEEDHELYKVIQKLDKPTIIAVNKVDELKGRESGDKFATEVAIALDVPGVIPISARTGENVAEELIPVIIDASPEAALAVGRELPAYRRMAAQRIIRNSTIVSLAAGLEPIPFIDIPILLGTQIRLVLRLAALYGEPMDNDDAKGHARELIATLAGGIGLRYLAEQAAKAVPFGGDFLAGAIAGAATWSIGQVALEYYEKDKQVSPKRLQQLYKDFYHRFRKGNKVVELQEQVRASLLASDTGALLEGPDIEAGQAPIVGAGLAPAQEEKA
jgi:small GTP-binding protein